MDRSTPRQVWSDIDIEKKLVSRRRPDRGNTGLQEERDRSSRSDARQSTGTGELWRDMVYRALLGYYSRA